MKQTAIKANINFQQLLKQFLEILPAEAVLYQEEDLRPFECDGLAAYRQLPLLVVLPDTVKQLKFPNNYLW
ncbi:hypothetical protein [Bathymodiolus platifrons methanotrophic gill symbiont]|uniref:hypothetical protein n=1 Tax=Bathymodiolus platifrons methanotrophic gill symbiont TaxID=113268 RepID=UPI001E5EF1D0|nr:hypothetical protein [Bathymodiolus platifrons methanotrophic gill symbiont]